MNPYKRFLSELLNERKKRVAERLKELERVASLQVESRELSSGGLIKLWPHQFVLKDVSCSVGLGFETDELPVKAEEYGRREYPCC